MSSPDRRRRGLALAALLLPLAACGFAPAYAPGGPGAALRGRVAPREPRNADELAFAEGLRRRLGTEGAGAHALDYTLVLAAVPQATDVDDVAIRTSVSGSADFRLSEAGTGRVLAEGRASATTSWAAAGSPVSALAGEAAARERLAQMLADQVATRLIAALAG